MSTGYGVLADEVVDYDEDDEIAILPPVKTYGSINGSIHNSEDDYLSDFPVAQHHNVSDYDAQHHNHNVSDYDEDDLVCNRRCCRASDGAVILSDHYQHSGSLSEGEQTYYPPDYNRAATGIASTCLVGWNVINILLGSSLLAYPFAVQQGGVVVIPLIAVVALVTGYTSHILIGLMYDSAETRGVKRSRMRISYSDVAQDAFNSTKGAILIETIQIVEMLAICVLNICVIGKLADEILVKIDSRICMLIAASLALPTFFIQKLAVVGWLQTIGVFSLFLGVFIVEAYCLVHVQEWRLSNLRYYDLSKLPMSVGIVFYSFGVHAVLPGLEEQMKRPKRMGRVVKLTFTSAFLFQSAFSVTNVLFYGDKTDQVITLDLEKHYNLGVTTAAFIGFSIICHFSLPTLVVLGKLDAAINQLIPCAPAEGSLKHNLILLVIRLVIIIFSLGVAIALPYFAYLMAFIGSSLTVLTALIIPVGLHLRLRHRELKPWQVALNAGILCLGIAFLFIGTYHSVREIVARVQLDSSVNH